MSTILNIGHRGAMGHAPENTLASFKKALELGADCIELDVYFIENQLVVFHDEYLDRTTNGHGKLMDQSYAYLRSLDAGEGELIPTLPEVCALINGRAGVNIELKGPGTAEPVIKFVHSLVDSGWHPSQILVSSFDRQLLQTCRNLDEEIMLGILFNGPVTDHFDFAHEIKALALHPSMEVTSAPLIKSAHEHGFKVLVFTVNDEKDIEDLHKAGVDGVFTNYPEKVSNTSIPLLNVKSSNARIPGFL